MTSDSNLNISITYLSIMSSTISVKLLINVSTNIQEWKDITEFLKK